MSYVDMQYTGPEWNNQTPPPLNASNLLDIGHALEALNVTQDERSTLGAETTDKLGQILTHIVESINGEVESDISSIQTQVNQKGNCNILVGSYIGNGGNLQLTLPTYAQFVIIQYGGQKNGINNGNTCLAFFIKNVSTFIYHSLGYGSEIYDCNFQEGSLYVRDSSSAPNNSGYKYTYIALG